MNNLIKLIIKNFIAITLSIVFAIICSSIAANIIYFIIGKFFPCSIPVDNLYIPPVGSPSQQPSCFFYLEGRIFLSGFIFVSLFISFYLLLRKSLGKFIK